MTRNMNDEKTLINTMKSMIITDYMAQKMFKPLQKEGKEEMLYGWTT